MNFGVITYIQHAVFKNKYYSYSPYIREMDLWIKNVDQVTVLAPKSDHTPDASEISYSRTPNFIEVPSLNFTNIGKAIQSVFRIPLIIAKIWKVFMQSDHIHLRCPGNISLLGCIVQVFFPNKPKTVKYAGNWDPDSKQPWSYKLQKFILNNRFLSRNLKVLVYGKWENQSKNVIPFFTASFSENEIVKHQRDYSKELNFIFVGTLSEGKQPLFAIKLVEKLLENDIEASLKIYGTGVLQENLSKYIAESKFRKSISLEGFIEKNELKEEYLRSHFLLLPSKSEGWPKVVAEAMFFGCIPVATPVSCVPWMLANGKRGILIPDDFDLANRLLQKDIQNSSKFSEMAASAQNWSQIYTLEKFEEKIAEFL